MTTPIADPSDLELLLGIADIDLDRATLLIELATELCQSIVSPLPDGARAVVLAVAARAYTNPGNAQAQAAGPYSVSYSPGASGGLYLSVQDRALLKRLAGRGGAFTVDPTPADAGTGLSPWDQNVTWLQDVPLAEDRLWTGQ